MPTAREQDNNGFLMVRGCPISSFGIFDYSAGQLGLPGDPNRIVKVFRPESAVSDAGALESFKNVPFIVDHEMLSGFQGDDNTTAPDDYGVDGVLTGNVYFDSPWMKGDIKIFSRRAQYALQNRKKDLSLGYSCDFEVKPGVWNGQPYEVVQTNMRGNHIALVDEGRVPGARVLDGQSRIVYDHLSFDVPSDIGESMKLRNQAAADNAIEKLKALLPELTAYLGGGEAAPAQGAAGEGGEPAAASAEPEAPAAQEAAVAGEPEAPAEPAAAPAEPAAAEGAGEGGGEPASLESLIAEVESVLAELKAACTAGGEGEGENGEPAADNLEGLQGAANEEPATPAATDEGQSSPVGEGQGTASAGPAAGEHATAADAAVQRLYADLAAKTRLYDRLSQVVGAFDHAAMDARQVAVYGVKKLGLKAASGTEMIALDAYLGGVEKAKRDAGKQVQSRVTTSAKDSKASSDALDAYLKG